MQPHMLVECSLLNTKLGVLEHHLSCSMAKTDAVSLLWDDLIQP